MKNDSDTRRVNRPFPIHRGARWLSGRVSDSGARGPGFEAYRRRVVSLSKTLYSPKVLVNYPGSDGSVPIWLKNCWLGRQASTQPTKTQYTYYTGMGSAKVKCRMYVLVGEPNSRILQKSATLALERYTADLLCIECLNIAWYGTTV